ncbi:MAG: hypothetical protein ACXWQE_10540, partial [Bdellovibrionales bacterium]
MTRVLLILLLVFCAFPAAAKGKPKAPVPPKADWKFAEARLRKVGFKKKFISALKKSYEPESFKDVL